MSSSGGGASGARGAAAAARAQEAVATPTAVLAAVAETAADPAAAVFPDDDYPPAAAGDDRSGGGVDAVGAVDGSGGGGAGRSVGGGNDGDDGSIGSGPHGAAEGWRAVCTVNMDGIDGSGLNCGPYVARYGGGDDYRAVVPLLNVELPGRRVEDCPNWAATGAALAAATPDSIQILHGFADAAILPTGKAPAPTDIEWAAPQVLVSRVPADSDYISLMLHGWLFRDFAATERKGHQKFPLLTVWCDAGANLRAFDASTAPDSAAALGGGAVEGSGVGDGGGSGGWVPPHLRYGGKPSLPRWIPNVGPPMVTWADQHVHRDEPVDLGGFLFREVFYGSDMARVALDDPSRPAVFWLTAVDVEDRRGLTAFCVLLPSTTPSTAPETAAAESESADQAVAEASEAAEASATADVAADGHVATDGGAADSNGDGIVDTVDLNAIGEFAAESSGAAEAAPVGTVDLTARAGNAPAEAGHAGARTAGGADTSDGLGDGGGQPQQKRQHQPAVQLAEAGEGGGPHLAAVAAAAAAGAAATGADAEGGACPLSDEADGAPPPRKRWLQADPPAAATFVAPVAAGSAADDAPVAAAPAASSSAAPVAAAEAVVPDSPPADAAAVAAPAPAAAAAGVAEADWPCMACTFENPAFAEACRICATPRSGGVGAAADVGGGGGVGVGSGGADDAVVGRALDEDVRRARGMDELAALVGRHWGGAAFAIGGGARWWG